MENIITINTENINGQNVQAVNARDLHGFLEVGRDFSSWVKDRIGQYDFEENLDYLVFHKTGENSSGGRPAKEYHISLDMAKELAMVERNAKGKEARQYFIECERRAKAAPTLDLNNPEQLRGLLSNYAERTQIAEAKVVELQPKAEVHDRLLGCDGDLTPRPASKVLDFPERKLSKWLDNHSWAFRQNGKGPLQAYSDKKKLGYVDNRLHYYRDKATGEEKVSLQLVITPKGMAKLARLLPREGGLI